MTRMGRPNDPQGNDARDASAEPRAWTKPVLVEYGHLAKLTRGGSGGSNEPGGKIKSSMCL